MKKLFTLLALGAAALLSANQYGYEPGSGSSWNNSQGNLQGTPQRNPQENLQVNFQAQPSPGNAYQNQQPYSQRNNQPYSQNNQGQQVNQNQGYQRGTADQDIVKKIHDILSSGWFSKGFENVSFSVINGNVTLKGTIDTIENKNKIEDDITRINGVRQVNNQITIATANPNIYSESQLQNSEKQFPQDYAATNSDRQLNVKIRDKLNGNWFSNATIVIKTANGIVTLSGTVDKFEDIQKINDQIKNIDGIRSLINQLSIKR